MSTNFRLELDEIQHNPFAPSSTSTPDHDAIEKTTNAVIVRLAYSPSELAEAFGVSRQWIHEQIRSGNIASTKMAGKRLIPATEVDRLLAIAA